MNAIKYFKLQNPAALEPDKGMRLAQRLIVSKKNYQIPGEPASSYQASQPQPRRITASSLFAEFVLFFRKIFLSHSLILFLSFGPWKHAITTQMATGEEGRQLLCVPVWLQPATKAPRGRPSPRGAAEENGKKRAETGGSG